MYIYIYIHLFPVQKSAMSSAFRCTSKNDHLSSPPVRHLDTRTCHVVDFPRLHGCIGCVNALRGPTLAMGNKSATIFDGKFTRKDGIFHGLCWFQGFSGTNMFAPEKWMLGRLYSFLLVSGFLTGAILVVLRWKYICKKCHVFNDD